MIIDLILLILGLLGLIIASYSDIKTTEIPDWLSYSLIISGFSLRMLHTIVNKDITYTSTALITFGIFFLVSNLMYYTKQWGGGDTKLLMAVSVIFATYPQNILDFFSPKLDNFYFPITIFINILLVGAIYSFMFIIYSSLKHKKEFLKEYKKYSEHTKNPRKIILVLSILLIILAFVMGSILTKIFLFAGAVSILVFLYIWIFVKSVEKSCMYTLISPSKLLEGDWLTKDIYYKNKLILKKPEYGVTKKDILILKKYKIKNVEIKKGLVFTPSFIIGTLTALIFGNPINYLF